MPCGALLKSLVAAGVPGKAVGDERAAKRYYVSGMVQGVGYRYFAKGAAKRFEVSGYARNLRDGRVEVYAIGSVAALDAFRGELRLGPRSGRVSEITEEPAPLDSRFADQFSIEHDD